MSSYDRGEFWLKAGQQQNRKRLFVCQNDTCNMMDRGQNDTYRTNMHEGDPKIDNQS